MKKAVSVVLVVLLLMIGSLISTSCSGSSAANQQNPTASNGAIPVRGNAGAIPSNPIPVNSTLKIGDESVTVLGAKTVYSGPYKQLRIQIKGTTTAFGKQFDWDNIEIVYPNGSPLPSGSLNLQGDIGETLTNLMANDSTNCLVLWRPGGGNRMYFFSIGTIKEPLTAEKLGLGTTENPVPLRRALTIPTANQELTVLEVTETNDQRSFSNPETRYQIKVQLKNTGTTPVTYSQDDFGFYNPEGGVTNSTIATGQIPPGGTVIIEPDYSGETAYSSQTFLIWQPDQGAGERFQFLFSLK